MSLLEDMLAVANELDREAAELEKKNSVQPLASREFRAMGFKIAAERIREVCTKKECDCFEAHEPTCRVVM